MYEVRIDGDSQDLAVVLAEVLSAVGKLYNFGGADEGKVKGVEEEEEPLALVAFERYFLEIAGGAVPGSGFEGGGDFAYGCSGDSGGHAIYYDYE
ncbi:unnamed protein product [Sphagnum balticum]